MQSSLQYLLSDDSVLSAPFHDRASSSEIVLLIALPLLESVVADALSTRGVYSMPKERFCVLLRDIPIILCVDQRQPVPLAVVFAGPDVSCDTLFARPCIANEGCEKCK